MLKNDLKGDTICNEKVFYTADGTYECAKNIVSFADTENISKWAVDDIALAVQSGLIKDGGFYENFTCCTFLLSLLVCRRSG